MTRLIHIVAVAVALGCLSSHASAAQARASVPIQGTQGTQGTTSPGSPESAGEVTVVSGSLAHHRLTDDLFRIDELWLQVTPDTEFHRWLSQGIDKDVAIILTHNPDRFADAKGVRILTGTLIHDTSPNASPIVHEMFLKDPVTGATGAVVFETTDAVTAKKFDAYDGVEVSLIVQIK